VVEVGASSLSDDLERKQLLYKRLGVQEYWVVDVAAGQVTAFGISRGESSRIQASQVLPGLGVS